MAAFFSSHRNLKTKKSVSSSEDSSLTDVSPYGTLTRNSGLSATGDAHKYRSNAKSHSKLPSLFSPFVKTQDKQEQLNELLASYSLHGLPKMPDLLARGRPHYDQSAFHLERHWTDIVTNHESLSKRQRDQQEALWELLSTEVEYLRKLRVIIDLFMCCLFHLQSEQLLTEIEVEKVFSNIVDVFYATCHFWVSHMSQVLRQARKTGDLLDPCLLKAGFLVFDKIFEPYAKYCLEQETCREYIKTKTRENELFRTFVTWGERQKQCNRLKLVDLIVKPWQRLTKYKLLLYAVSKPLDRMADLSAVDEQKRDITRMIEKVEKFLHYVNTSMRQKHDDQQLSLVIDRIESYDAIDVPSDECVKLVSDFCKLDLTCPVPGCGEQEMRILLLEGSLKLRDRDSKTDVYCFLFTDLLLITKPAARRGDKVKVIKPPMRLDKIVICNLRDVASFMLLYLNEYHVAQAVYTLHGDSKLWLDSIGKAQSDYKEKRSRYMSRVDSLLFDLYDDADDDFSIYIDRPSASVEQSTSSLSRCNSTSSIGNLPDSAPIHRSASCASGIESELADLSSTPSEFTGRLPRPRSAILARDSSPDSRPTGRRSSRDDSDIKTSPPGQFLTVPQQSWYRSEVSANIEAAQQLGVEVTCQVSRADGTKKQLVVDCLPTEGAVTETLSTAPSYSAAGGDGAASRTSSGTDLPRLSTHSQSETTEPGSVPSQTRPVAEVMASHSDASESNSQSNNNSAPVQDDSVESSPPGPPSSDPPKVEQRRRLTAAERRRLNEVLLRNPTLEVSEV